MEEKVRYYREWYGKVTESRGKCLVVKEDFKKEDCIVFQFDENKQIFVALES
jgi:hypothetical protein